MLLLDKIRKLAKYNGWTLAKMERELGFSNNSISKWSKNKPSVDKVKKVAELFSLPVEWFLSEDLPTTENTPPFLLSALALNKESIVPDNPQAKFILSTDEVNLLQNYKTMTHNQRKGLYNIAELILGKHSQLSESVENNVSAYVETHIPKPFVMSDVKHRNTSSINERSNVVSMKVYDQPASAGAGNQIYDADTSYEIVEVDESTVPFRAAFGVRISGDSMNPTIYDGDVVWVESMQSINDGEIGVFVLNGESLCKKLEIDYEGECTRLISRNPSYAPIEISEHDEMTVIGKVLSKAIFF